MKKSEQYLKVRNMKTIIFWILLIVYPMISCSGTNSNRCEENRHEKAKTNVIFFLVDDFGWRDLSCYGSEFYETPNMDKLASEGMKFNQAYAAHPRCVPSRYAIFTGKYPARARMPGGGGLIQEDYTMGDAFKEAGYSTFFAGKWHLSNKEVYPDDEGFDVNITGGHAGAVHTHFYPYNKKGKSKKQIISGLEEGNPGEYLTDRLTVETIKFIEQNKDEPIFAVLAHYAVHTPIESKEEYTSYYKRKIKSMDYADIPEYSPEGPGVTKMRQDNATYAGMIKSVDESIGRIMNKLEVLGIAENTIIVFTSDHGGLSNRGDNNRKLATSNSPLRAGKGWLYEGGIRIPTIVKWPGVAKAGSETEAVITNTDFYPTLVEAIGQSIPPDILLDGKSFVSVLKSGDKHDRGAIFWHSPKGRPHSTGDSNSSAMRSGKYKLIDWYDEGRVELFDLSKDLGEKNDLSSVLPDVRDGMCQELFSWRKEVNAIIRKKK